MSFNLIFMGTPEFGREFLEYIHSNVEFNIKAVYTQAPKKSNRGQKVNLSPVHKYAKDKNLNVFFPSKFTKSEIDNIKRIKPKKIFTRNNIYHIIFFSPYFYWLYGLLLLGNLLDYFMVLAIRNNICF